MEKIKDMHIFIAARLGDERAFKEFVKFMVKQRAYTESLGEQDREIFMYHFEKIPEYVQERLNSYKLTKKGVKTKSIPRVESECKC